MKFFPQNLAGRIWAAASIGLALAAQTQAQDEPPGDAAVKTAREFVGHLAAGRFDEAAGMVAPSAKETLSEDALRLAWTSLEKRHGAYRDLGRAYVEKSGEFRVVYIAAQFANRAFEFKTPIDAQSAVAGLQFTAPMESRPSFGAPSYSDSTMFVSVDYEVVNGSIKLPGTMTLPKTNPPYPVALLLPGSGRADRDETVGPNKPLRDLAWGLATMGVASVRFDKRTLTYGQRLDFRTMTYREEIVDDAAAAIRQLRRDSRVDKENIFIVGHGFGGQLAPAIASAAGAARGAIFTATQPIAGIAILAGSPRSIIDVTIDHLNHIAMEDGTLTLQEAGAIQEFEAGVEAMSKRSDRNAPPVMGLTYTYLREVNAYDAIKEALKLDAPMLILQGERDTQTWPNRDFRMWKDGLASKANVAYKVYPDLNHLFMPGSGPSYPSEYESPGHVSDQVVTDLASWILRIAHGR